MVVELIGVHGSHEQEIVGALGEVGQQVAEFHARLAVSGELAWGAHEYGGLFFDERESDVLGERFWEGLAVEFVEFWFGVVEVQLAGCSLHEDEDAVLRFRREVRLARSEWVGR